MDALVILGFLALLVALDALVPARVLPAVRGWKLKGIVSFVLFMALVMTGPVLWDAWLGEYRLIDATGLGVIGGGLVGLVVQQFLSYWWHRTMHRSPVLWRLFHQMHHSAERVDIYGNFWFHPLDVLGFGFVGSLALVLVVGVSAEAAIVANVITALASSFGHANLRTPRWLGYFVQRPENHALHHERGVHGSNYGDIALWDMVFGTWRNPEGFPAETGFYDGASSRVVEMLVFRDVSEPRRSAEDRPMPARSSGSSGA